jgi:omega-hydroxy-beta-dihydromenaquinone-9 sulfotransferase
MNSVGGLIAESDSSKPKIRLTWRTLLLLPLPRFLSGFRLGDWWRLLREHRFSVDPIFWPRAVWATLGAAVTSILARLEEKVTPEPVDAELLERPVFILGLPRSGTTHLFELLSQSPDLCFPTRFDAFNPHSFLLLRRIGLFALLSKLPKFKRAMDNLRVGWDSPEEDIVALAILASKGERLFQMFPRDSAKTRNLPVDISGKRAKSLGLIRCLRPFLQKLIHLHGKRVLLKSPGHMGRVEEILEVFPQAKFVTIFRNPLHQTASLRAIREFGNPFWCALQWPMRKTTASLQTQERLLRCYFQTRQFIPAANLFETTFEELVADRSGTISRICEKFSIKPPTNFEAMEAKARYARPPGLPPDSWAPMIREHYKPLFDAGLYPPP